MSAYDVFYMLKPHYEDLERGGKDWWKLKWKPIWRQTYSAYISKKFYGSFGFGFFYYNSDARNGWARSYKHRNIRITFLFWDVDFWIRYDFLVHKDGALDENPRRPLIFN